MTVAAVILSATAEGAVADTLGQPRVRRLVDIAWSGGALPVVVRRRPTTTARSPRRSSGARRSIGTPAAPEAGPAGQMVRGAELALAEVRETSAVLIWPARMTWVGPETVTSLIEAHGTDAGDDPAAGLGRDAGLAGARADREPGCPARRGARTGCRRT